MLLHDDWALAMFIYGWFLAACYPDGTSHEDYLPFERLLTPKSYPAMLNTRKNARRTLWDPSAAGAKRVGAQQNGAWRIAWRARGPAAGLWCCGKRPCSRLAVW